MPDLHRQQSFAAHRFQRSTTTKRIEILIEMALFELSLFLFLIVAPMTTVSAWKENYCGKRYRGLLSFGSCFPIYGDCASGKLDVVACANIDEYVFSSRQKKCMKLTRKSHCHSPAFYEFNDDLCSDGEGMFALGGCK